MKNEKRNARDRANYRRRMEARGYVGFVDRTPTQEAIETARRLSCAFVMLGHGYFALIDYEDLAEIGQHRWTKHKKGYAVRMARAAAAAYNIVAVREFGEFVVVNQL